MIIQCAVWVIEGGKKKIHVQNPQHLFRFLSFYQKPSELQLLIRKTQGNTDRQTFLWMEALSHLQPSAVTEEMEKYKLQPMGRDFRGRGGMTNMNSKQR